MSAAQLIVVGTPIGNLGDWSPRAQQTLADVGLIACEDTRRTGLLLSKHGITNPGMVVMNEHSEQRAVERVIETLGSGLSVAVVSDAGMPAVSDPGAAAVAAAADAGFEVVVVPGPSAVSAAIAVAGFAGTRYVFEGFLPRKGRERTELIEGLADEPRIVVLYEAPHRIVRTLEELAASMDPTRRCVVARELTKLHEQVWRGTLADAGEGVGEPRGEYVIVIDRAAPPGPVGDDELVGALRAEIERGSTRKDAAAQVAKAFGVGRRRVYELASEVGRSA